MCNNQPDVVVGNLFLKGMKNGLSLSRESWIKLPWFG